MVNLFQCFQRIVRRVRMTQRLSVWTRNRKGSCFHYDIRICPARNAAGTRREFLVRFDRTGAQGNTERCYRRMQLAQVQRLVHESA